MYIIKVSVLFNVLVFLKLCYKFSWFSSEHLQQPSGIHCPSDNLMTMWLLMLSQKSQNF